MVLNKFLHPVELYLLQHKTYKKFDPYRIHRNTGLRQDEIEEKLIAMGYIAKYTVEEPSGTLLEEMWDDKKEIPEIVQDSWGNKFFTENLSIIKVYVKRR